MVVNYFVKEVHFFAFSNCSFVKISSSYNFLLLLELKKTSIYNDFLISGYSSVVERLVANEKVEGSTPFARSKKKDL